VSVAAGSSLYAIKPDWLITMQPVGAVLTGQVVVVRDEVIADILPADELEQRYPDVRAVDLPEQVLLPGLINMHTHSAMSLLRGLADDLPLMTWLHKHIWPAEQRWLGHEYVEDGVRLACLEYLRGGITCYNDSYFFPDVAAEVTRAAGMRAVMGAPVIDFPTAWAKDSNGYFERAMALLQSCRDEDLIEMSFAPHAPYSVTDADFERMRDLSAEHDLRIHLHLLETSGEIADSVEQFGVAPIQRLQQLGLLNERLIAVTLAPSSARLSARIPPPQPTSSTCLSRTLADRMMYCKRAGLRSCNGRIGPSLSHQVEAMAAN